MNSITKTPNRSPNRSPNSSPIKSNIKSPNKNTFIKERQVLILYTGGTIGSVKGENGLAPKRKFLTEYMLNHPNLCDKEYTIKMREGSNKDVDGESNESHFLITPLTFSETRINYKIFEFDEIIDSANMHFQYWKMLGTTLEKFYHEYDAFIILHGTDTMHYTASVLSFMLENLNKPVILTGSQVPLGDMSNDALKNLVDSLIIAGTYHIPEVSLLFNSKLFRGNRTIKNDNMGLEAFESPNLRPLANIGVTVKVNWDIILPPPTEEFNFFQNLDNRVTVLKFFPIICDSIFESYFKDPIKAVIIESYGTGTLPKDRTKILSIIKEADERGVVIINVSQSRKGLGLNIAGGFLEKLGVVFAGDMTVECCLAKISYLLGKGYDHKTIKTLFRENLRGEISILQNEYLSIHSNKFVDALFTLMNRQDKNEDNYVIASTLLPTIINEIVGTNNLELLKKLKKVIKKINFREQSNKNPLHISSQKGNLEITKFLIKCRININELDDEKQTPLNYACINNHQEVAMYLKENGAILNQHENINELLCALAYQSDTESIKLFYKCGANLMIGNYDKSTIAHIATLTKNLELMNFLIKETNINIMVKDRWGKTPYDDSSGIISSLIETKYCIDLKSKKKRKKFSNLKEKKINEEY